MRLYLLYLHLVACLRVVVAASISCPVAAPLCLDSFFHSFGGAESFSWGLWDGDLSE